MLDIPGAAVLDKQRLLGGCVRLPVSVDAAALAAEIAALPSAVWDTTDGRVGVHRAAGALFLRGYAPARGDMPIEDRPVLERLPFVRSLIETAIRAQPLRCLLARLPAGTAIPVHVDRPPYFSKTLRLHVPVETNSEVHMVAGRLTYHMKPGEVWALNNSAPHAVWNAHPHLSRTHLICDFLPSAELLNWVAQGDRDLGSWRPDVDLHIAKQGQSTAMAGG